MSRLIGIVAVLAALVVTAPAQMPNMEPPAELKQLEWMLGDWTTKMTWTMEGQAMEMSGEISCVREGQFIKSTSWFEMMGMKFTEVQYLGWDKDAKKYIGWSFTNFSAAPRIERGDWKGDTLTLVSDPWDAGMGPMESRGTMVRKGKDEGHLTLEFKMEGKWQKVGEGTFKRKS